ncbi:hypothetical protein JI752_012060 [Lysobacter sp. MMG2]|uniref:hypothetical protein n=1 Tax=Lysobacter sp. MMG2 TaxID=2801338 RepID=UPI001C217404|nr:hypothetical protein [Lysobacter sp. MMG2]MBU8976878.1 hypothetical protein [Lysobacter sp. MMG2]
MSAFDPKRTFPRKLHDMQSFEVWEPLPDAPDFLHGAWVLHLGTNHLLVVCDGHFRNGKCPVLVFGPVESIQIHDDTLPTWDPQLAATQPGGRPFLKVANSAWAQKVGAFRGPLSHYCILSGDCCVELLSEHSPQVRWTTAAEIESLFGAGLDLGGG